MRSSLLTLASFLSLAGCRADVAGYWSGTIGHEPAFLSLEQSGAEVRGEACLAGACDGRARGEVVEGRLALDFGCLGCASPPEVELDLQIDGYAMEGVAIVAGCACESSGCGCGQPAHFSRTSAYEPGL